MRSPKLHRRPARTFRARAGLGLIECMISLAITAALLTAVGGAFNGASAAINENDQFFSATQTARVAINRIMIHVRRGSIDENSTVNNLRIITDTGADITYLYDAANKQIKLVTNTDTTDPDYVLARNVIAASFQTQSGTDYAGNPCIVRVTMQLTVQVGDNQVTFSGSGAPRRNLAF